MTRMTEFSFFVEGNPVPKGSMKAFIRPGMKFPVVVNDNSKSKPWASVVSLTALTQREKASWRIAETEPLGIHLRFYLARPKGHYGSGKNALVLKPSAPSHPTAKIDVDKLSRLILDALTGIIWRDDGQVVELQANKDFTTLAPNSVPQPTGVQIRVYLVPRTPEAASV